MRIAFIGYGSMTKALAGKWADKHELLIAGRSNQKARALAEELGHRASAVPTIVEAADRAETVVLATTHEAIPEFIDSLAPVVRGKPVVDINNPVTFPDLKLSNAFSPSLAEWIAGRLDGAHVVKAFNQCQAGVWAMPEPIFDGRRLVVPLCGDDNDAKQAVGTLVRDVGCEPIDLGPLDRAHAIEATASLVIQLLFSGRDPHTVFNLIQPESKPIG